MCCHQDGSMEATWSWETIEFGICTVVISHGQTTILLKLLKRRSGVMCLPFRHSRSIKSPDQYVIMPYKGRLTFYRPLATLVWLL